MHRPTIGSDNLMQRTAWMQVEKVVEKDDHAALS